MIRGRRPRSPTPISKRVRYIKLGGELPVEIVSGRRRGAAGEGARGGALTPAPRRPPHGEGVHCGKTHRPRPGGHGTGPGPAAGRHHQRTGRHQYRAQPGDDGGGLWPPTTHPAPVRA
eukprot:433398-Prorocentrum_minimum.AAC.1